MQTRIITDEKEWDEVISKFPEATIYHTSLWKKLLEKHGNKGFLVVAEENDSIEGILPIYNHCNIFGINHFVSIPVSNQDGLITKNDMCINEIINCLPKLIKEFNPSQITIQSKYVMNKKTIIKPMLRHIFNTKKYNKEFIWKNFFTEKQRNIISKSINQEVEFFCINDPSYYKEAFQAYRNVQRKRNILRIGLNKEFFKDTFEILKDNLNVFIDKKDDEILTISTRFVYNNVLYAWLKGSLTTNNFNLRPEFHYWKMIEWSCDNDIKYMDFGIVPLGRELSLHHFKNKFKTHTEVTFSTQIINSRLGLIEDFIYSTLLGIKDLFVRK